MSCATSNDRVKQFDIGVVIRLQLPEDEDISSATRVEIRFQRSASGTTGTWVATAASPTTIEYTTVAGDLDESGTYRLEGYVELPGGFQGTTAKVDLPVDPTIVVP